jgi:RNA recognition motif-containing protein
MGADDARKLFVGGLSDSLTEQDLRTIFEGAGLGVVDVNVPRDRESGRPRGFGFVTLATVEAADAARAKLDGSLQAGRPMSVRRFAQDATRRASAERPARADDRTVFLGKLPYDATADEIGALFQQYDAGTVERVTLPVAPDGRPRGFGFVTLESPEAVALALDRLARAQLRGRQLVVTAAQPRGREGAPASRGGGFAREPGAQRDGGYAQREGYGQGPVAHARDGVSQPNRDSGLPRGPWNRPPLAPRGPRFDGGRYDASREPAAYPQPHAPRGEFDEHGEFSDEPAIDPDFREGASAGDEDAPRPDSARQRGKEKKKQPRAAEKSSRRERGGGGSWQRWDTDED